MLDTMTMPRFLALKAEWRARPPAHWLIASYLDYKPPADGQAIMPNPERIPCLP